VLFRSSVWASVRYLTGAASIRADRAASSSGVSIRIRHRAGVAAGMRAQYGSTVFLIQAVNPQGKEWFDLVCEVVA
jgi:SPP1 family predicted phage head-tail adaptor